MTAALELQMSAVDGVVSHYRSYVYSLLSWQLGHGSHNIVLNDEVERRVRLRLSSEPRLSSRELTTFVEATVNAIVAGPGVPSRVLARAMLHDGAAIDAIVLLKRPHIRRRVQDALRRRRVTYGADDEGICNAVECALAVGLRDGKYEAVPGKTLENWLGTIINNKVHDELVALFRERDTQRALSDEASSAAPSVVAPHQVTGEELLKALVQDKVLSEREAFVMRQVAHEVPYDQIAAALKIRAKSRISEIVAEVQRKVKDLAASGRLWKGRTYELPRTELQVAEARDTDRARVDGLNAKAGSEFESGMCIDDPVTQTDGLSIGEPPPGDDGP